MSTRPYLAVTTLIFFVVGLLHLLRLVYHWPVQLGGLIVPPWPSYLGLAVAWGLSVWAYRLYRQ